jgi:hypothetical protein
LQFIGCREKTRPRSVKKEPLDNIPGKAESSSYPLFFVLKFLFFFLVSGNRVQRGISLSTRDKITPLKCLFKLK